VNTGLRVAVIDSDEFVREGRVLLLQSQPNIQIVFESGDPSTALDQAVDYLLDVIVLDTRIPGWKAAHYLVELSKRLSSSGNEAQLLALTAFGSPEFELACLRSGAAAVVANDQGVSELLRQVKLLGSRDNTVTRGYLEGLMSAVNGTIAPNPKIARSLSGMDSSQVEVVKAMLEGLTDSQIARQLDLTRYRVTKFIESLRESSDCRTRQQLAIELIGFGTI
jgi:DNA-binding NarL/FixJ family response regulator